MKKKEKYILIKCLNGIEWNVWKLPPFGNVYNKSNFIGKTPIL